MVACDTLPVEPGRTVAADLSFEVDGGGRAMYSLKIITLWKKQPRLKNRLVWGLVGGSFSHRRSFMLASRSLVRSTPSRSPLQSVADIDYRSAK
jgi:hypothetical protein